MASGGKSQPASRAQLMHPIYLDTPMLLTFLATIENGVSMSAEIAESQSGTTTSSFGGDGELSLPPLASVLGLNLGTSGRYGRENANETAAEQRFKREHTTASLFNRLHLVLETAGAVKSVRGVDDMAGVAPGDLICVEGVVRESPIEVILDAVDRLMPFFEQYTVTAEGNKSPQPNRAAMRKMTSEQQAAMKQQASASAEQREQLDLGMMALKLLRTDLRESPVVDLVVESNGFSGLLTASREFFPDSAKASLIGGTFKLIGKVSGVTAESDARTPITRRGAVAGMTPMVKLLLELADSLSAFIDVDSDQIAIDGPCVQVIPLAIYV